MTRSKSQRLADKYGVTLQGVRQWFYRNNRSVLSKEDVAHYKSYMKLKALNKKT